MKKRFDEEQVFRILRGADVSGVQIREVCQRHDITEQTFFRWRKKYGGWASQMRASSSVWWPNSCGDRGIEGVFRKK
jgi:putative transposase